MNDGTGVKWYTICTYKTYNDCCNYISDYYNVSRTHKSLEKDASVSRPVQVNGRIGSEPKAVGGLTIISDDPQSLQILDIRTQKIRSVFSIFGLFMLRCWTVNCWRSARFSRTLSCLLLNMSFRHSEMSVVRAFRLFPPDDFPRINR